MSPASPRPVVRPVVEADREALLAVYASTRDEELAVVPWTREQRDAFLRQQFEWQDREYRQRFVAASFDVIEVDGRIAGRLYVDRRPDALHIIDIALLPAARGRGIGTLLLQALIDEATTAGLPVSIHVEQFNPALRWYTRLGFRPVQLNGMYLLMRRDVAAMSRDELDGSALGAGREDHPDVPAA